MPRLPVLIAAKLLLVSLAGAADADESTFLLFAELGSSEMYEVGGDQSGDGRTVGGGGVYVLLGEPTFFRTGLRVVTRGGSLRSGSRDVRYRSTNLAVPFGIGHHFSIGSLRMTAATDLMLSVLAASTAEAVPEPGTPEQNDVPPAELGGGVDLSIYLPASPKLDLFMMFFAETTLTGIRGRGGLFRTADKIYHDGGSNRTFGARIGVSFNPA